MTDINAMIAEILRLPLNEITEHTSMETHPQWDSLSHMEIIAALEKNFSIELSGDEIIEITSINKIKNIIAKKARVA